MLISSISYNHITTTNMTNFTPNTNGTTIFITITTITTTTIKLLEQFAGCHLQLYPAKKQFTSVKNSLCRKTAKTDLVCYLFIFISHYMI